MTPPVAPDETTRRRLLLVKAVYGTALIEARAPLLSHRRIIAVVTLDLATETMLKALVWALGASRQPKTEFGPLMQQAASLVAKAHGISGDPPALPGEAGAVQVHRVRNDAQHDARAPSDEVLNDCRTHTRDFLQGVAQKVWGVDFDTLATSDAIENPGCRAEMGEAEAALVRRDWLEAARYARTALMHARSLAGEQLLDTRGPSWTWPYQSSPAEGHNALARFSREVERELEALRDQLTEVALGLDYTNQHRLARLTGEAWWSSGGQHWSDPRGGGRRGGCGVGRGLLNRRARADRGGLRPARGR